jgi:immunoglobulin-like protein involved in spore germination/sporulation and spore germination protein
MLGRVGFLVVLAALLAGCGGGGGGTSTTTTGGQVALKVYFFRGNALVPVTVHVPETQAVAAAAIGALLAGPPAGYETAIPAGVTLQSVAVSTGVATARFVPDKLVRAAKAQVVYTLTQFPTITSVDGATALDFADLTPQAAIFVAQPIRNSTVTSPVHASGTADVFEATFQAEVWSGHRLLATQTITASSGTGTRGTWSATFDLPPGPARLVFFEVSADNGARLHETSVDLTVR